MKYMCIRKTKVSMSAFASENMDGIVCTVKHLGFEQRIIGDIIMSSNFISSSPEVQTVMYWPWLKFQEAVWQ